MADPFTIRIFVPDGDPEGVRLIDRMNWTGLGLVFPREKWPETKSRPEFGRTGIYVLVGYKGEADELPTLPPAYSSLRHRFAGRQLQGGGGWTRLQGWAWARRSAPATPAETGPRPSRGGGCRRAASGTRC